jgi:3-phosphoshikimate 1-carboxyvinyltransferase
MPDHIRVHPSSLQGEVRVPGDKSLSHRALILAALVGEPVSVCGLAPSGDVASTAGCLRRLGATVDLEVETAAFAVDTAGHTVAVAGTRGCRSPAGGEGSLRGTVTGPLHEPDDVLDCGNSGTALRLLAGVVAGIDGVSVLTGDASLRGRPVERVTTPLRTMGARLDARDGGRRPPLVVRGGRLRAIDHASPVASAQVKSCVLLAGLAADGPTSVRSPLPSRDHTERLLGHLGVSVERREEPDGPEVVRLTPGRLRARPIAVSGDPSSAAFWLVAAAAGAGEVRLPGVCANPTRLGVVAALRALGAEVEVVDTGEVAGEPVADLAAAPGRLNGARLSGRTVVDAIDELPVLALAGAVSRDGLEVVDAAELRVKESDRIATLAATLRAVGLTVEERPDGYRVPGGQRPGPGTVHAHGDHRIAMTAAIAGVLATGPVEVTGFGSVATSYPSFLADLVALGGAVEVLDGDG